MNLKTDQSKFDQFLDRGFVALIAVVFGYILVSLITFPLVPE
jgi:hypothetical protein